MKKFLFYTVLILTATIAVLLAAISDLRREKHRLQRNQDALLADVEYYQTEAGKYAASVQALELEKSELRESRDDLVKTVADLNIKLRRVEAIAQAATKTNVEIRAEIRDSIVYRDTSQLRLPSINWSDAWVRVSGIITPDRHVKLQIESTDTLTQIVHRVPRRFLFFRWGTKAIRQEITTSNPHTHIVYAEYIELKNKRK